MKAHRIEGTIALVTGANRGIGRALTEALLARGVKKIYATARNPATLGALRDARLVPLRLDVGEASQVRAAVAAASDIRLVFSNAGVTLNASIAGPTVLEQARREMEVNYFGALQLLQQIAPILAKNGGGALVNVGSVAGLTNIALFPTYSASKAALHSLTQAARVLLAGQGISVFGVVFGVYPGPVDTDMVRELAMPKASARDVALSILDGIEIGQEDIFPDSFSREFGPQFEASPKTAERQVAAMVAAMATGSAA